MVKEAVTGVYPIHVWEDGTRCQGSLNPQNCKMLDNIGKIPIRQEEINMIANSPR